MTAAVPLIAPSIVHLPPYVNQVAVAIGYAWPVLFSVGILRARIVPRWLALFGLVLGIVEAATILLASALWRPLIRPALGTQGAQVLYSLTGTVSTVLFWTLSSLFFMGVGIALWRTRAGQQLDSRGSTPVVAAG